MEKHWALLPALATAVLLLAVALVTPAWAQSGEFPPLEALEGVMPGADRFSDREGTPPVFRGYRTDPTTGAESLVGYVFLTSDLPPEVKGYDAPIEVLVGMDLEGTLTGVRVMRYQESLYRSRGHFFGARGFQEQFTGKHIRDAFRIRRDLDGISGATISVDAMARSVRDSARRVATAYLSGGGDSGSGSGSGADTRLPATLQTLEQRSWLELAERGPVSRMMVVRGDIILLELFVTHLWEEAAGEILLGPDRFAEALERGGERARTDHLLFLGLDGSLIWFRPHLLSLVQGSDTVSASSGDVVLFEPPRGGKVGDQLRSAGIWMVDQRIDMTQPFTVHFGGSLGMDVFALEVPGREAPAERMAASTPSAAPEAGEDAGAVAPTGVTRGEDEPGATPVPEAADEEAPEAEDRAPNGGEMSEEGEPAAAPSPGSAPGSGEDALAGGPLAGWAEGSLDLAEGDEESLLARTLARTAWDRVARLLLLLGLVTAAFVTRKPTLRWAAMGGTLLFLGFLDHGFLSISHVTSALAVGPGVFLQDISLLVMVTFTVVTTLLWGRIFCGYLCPFGVLQDLLERVVPRRFRRELPPRIHQGALRIKYLILAIILVPAVLGIHVSLFQYFEPFGTVFFFSASVVLWAIALGFLAAAAVVPRFYCRYACPLGAALAVASRVSPFRIRRVEQCTVCRVCEQSCPTGAIQKEVIDFPECVRCGICEVKLIRKAGTCRHEMEDIRPRLVQLSTAPGRRP